MAVGLMVKASRRRSSSDSIVANERREPGLCFEVFPRRVVCWSLELRKNGNMLSFLGKLVRPGSGKGFPHVPVHKRVALLEATLVPPVRVVPFVRRQTKPADSLFRKNRGISRWRRERTPPASAKDFERADPHACALLIVTTKAIGPRRILS